jgi:hypothetical protein
VKYWEIIADNLRKAGWSLGWVSAVDSNGRTIFVADAHRGDESVSLCVRRKVDCLRHTRIDGSRLRRIGLTAWRGFSRLGVVWNRGQRQEAFLPELSSPFSDLHCQGSTHWGQTKKRKDKHETSKPNSHSDGDCLHRAFTKRASGSRDCPTRVQHGGRGPCPF